MRKDMECYMNEIHKNLAPHIKESVGKLKKISNDDVVIPSPTSIELLFAHNYNREQLKSMVRFYKLKQSGNKNELYIRIQQYLLLSSHAMKVQSLFRGHVYRRYVRLRGPALYNRSLCVNEDDFLSMDPVKEIPNTQFYSYKDKDGFVYGFNIISLYNLIRKTSRMRQIENPYNRKRISNNVIRRLNSVLRIGKLLGDNINVEVDSDLQSRDTPHTLEQRIQSVFHAIDQRGHYSNIGWFTSLDMYGIRRFVRELIDIWNFRADLSSSMRREMCPPTGDPFRGVRYSQFLSNETLDAHQELALFAMEKMVSLQSDTGKDLGAFYILGALTLANSDAADALPWLYQSFAYNS